MSITKKNVTKAGVKLVQFKLSKKAYKDLEKLREETGSLTISEAIRDSIQLYTWAVDKQKRGYSLFCLPENEKDKNFEVVLPLPNV